jgi:site-specific recombinase XerD
VLKKFAAEEQTTHFTTEFGHRFLWERYQIQAYGEKLTSHKRTLRRAVTILDAYQRNGFIHKRQPIRLHIWHGEYSGICEEFLRYSKARGLYESTLRQYRQHLERFIDYLANNRINKISKITAENVDGYFATYLGYAKPTISFACYVLKMFFLYALEHGHMPEDMTRHIPRVKINKRSNLPSVFTKDEIERLLGCVDRGSPVGKRDYAIILLAVRYGMRVGDITALKLSDFDFTAKKITYNQNKEENPTSFDMLESVGWALIDYLKNARPATDSPYFFVRMIAPYDKFGDFNNLENIIGKYRIRAGIKVLPERKHGMHSLRHSLASHMFAQGQPLTVVSEVLDHVEIDSTMIYTKVDIPMLSLCALEVPHDSK